MADPGTEELPFSITGLQALPYSPRQSKEHVRSTAGQEACDKAARITFLDDLAKEAALLLQLLYEVDDAKHLALYSPEGMGVAAERYERFWLPLLATHPNPAAIAAPLDVAWAWLMHSLAPSKYAADVQAITGKLAKEISAKSAQNRDPQGVTRAQAAWEARFPEEAFEPPGPSGHRQPGEDGTSAFSSRLTYSLVDAAARQQVFLYQVNLPHWKDLGFLMRCVERYKKFLYIRRVHPSAFLVPTFDTDLVWHAHMGCHASYVPDVEKATSRFFDHDDSINDRTSGAKLDVSYRNTYKLWFDTFDEEYVFPGGMYRGKLPGHSLQAAWEELRKLGGDSTAEAVNPVPDAGVLADCHNHERTFDVIPIRDDTSQGSIARVFDVVDAAAGPKTRYQLVLRSPNMPSAPSASVSVLNSKGQLVVVSRIVGQDQLPFTEEPLRMLSFPMLPSDPQASPAMLIQRCDASGGSDWGICICEPPHTTACLADGYLFRLGRGFYPRSPESTQGPQYTGKAAFEGGCSQPGKQILRFTAQEPDAASANEMSWWSCFGGTKAKEEGGKLVAEVRLTNKQQVVVGPGQEAPCALAFGGSICLQAAFLSNLRI